MIFSQKLLPRVKEKKKVEEEEEEHKKEKYKEDARSWQGIVLVMVFSMITVCLAPDMLKRRI
jgi:hypothetical protein